MRNGNFVSDTQDLTGKDVLILPMRNGNILGLIVIQVLLMVLILPMRNGNLTVKKGCQKI